MRLEADGTITGTLDLEHILFNYGHDQYIFKQYSSYKAKAKIRDDI